MTPDFPLLSLSIQRCNAVYIPDEAATITAFQQLGSTNIIRLCTDTNQAVGHRASDGIFTLTDAGTRFSTGTFREKVCDLFQDIDCDPYDIGGGRMVAHRPFVDAAELYAWVAANFPQEPIRIEGQSLGGWKPSYAAEYLHLDQIHSVLPWESPHQGNDAWWLDMQNRGFLAKMQQMYNGKDPWALWNWEDFTLNKGPGQILWFHDGIWEYVTKDKLPVADLWDLYDLPHSADHYPENIIPVVNAFLPKVA